MPCLLEGEDMGKSATAGFLALSVIGICVIEPGQAQTQELTFGKHRASASFPCAPKLSKQLAGRGESGSEIFLTTLGCTRGEHYYSLGVMEYPPEVMKANSVEDLLESYGQNAGAKKHVRIKATQRITHKGFPAMRYHVLDSRPPEKELVIMNVLVEQSMLIVHVHARSALFQTSEHATFADSLSIKGSSVK